MNERYERLLVVEETASLAHVLAEHVASAARGAIASRGRFDLALAGGSTPEATYKLLAAAPYRDTVDWSRVHVFFSDERCVPPTDPQSNYKMALDALLGRVGIAPDHIARILGEATPADAATAYASILRAEFGPAPVLDLVLLGMGTDGHTASLFPGNDPFYDDDALVRAPYVDQFSTFRITFTPRLINAARGITIATAGSSKADALTAVFDGPDCPSEYPIQAVTADAKTTWLVDRAAAARLDARRLARAVS